MIMSTNFTRTPVIVSRVDALPAYRRTCLHGCTVLYRLELKGPLSLRCRESPAFAGPLLGIQTRIRSTSSTASIRTNNEYATFSLIYSSHPKHCLCLLQFLEVDHVCVKPLRLALSSLTNTFRVKSYYRQVR
jgi:hypothetical protein